MKVSVIGISHHTASVALREQFSLPGELAQDLLKRFHSEDVFEEAMVLDTCNRTEVYFVSKDDRDSLTYVLGCVAELKGSAGRADPSSFYRYDGIDAVNHLFRIAAALESQIVGEHQILGQVKDAYHKAVEARTAKFFLNKLLHWSFRVGKRVQTETDLGRGSASVANAAVDLACQIFSRLDGKSVMLIGAGQTAELAAGALIRHNVARIVVANRTFSRAEEVAANLAQSSSNGNRVRCPARDLTGSGPDQVACPAALRLLRGLGRPGTQGDLDPSPELTAEAITLDDIPNAIAGIDLIISSAGAKDLILTYDKHADAIRRSGRSLFMLDIAIPRNIDPKLSELPNVYLYNMDDLDHLVTENIQRRRQEIPRTEAIVADEVRQFAGWLNSLQFVPTIKLLQQLFDELQQAEINRYSKRFSADERDELEEFAKCLCKKILHRPISFLRQVSAEAAGSNGLAAVDAVRRMFELDALEQEK